MDLFRKLDELQKIFIIMSIIGIVGLIVLFHVKDNNPTTYMKSAEVIQIRDNVAYLEDITGNIWTVEDDTLKLYGRYIITFDSMNTEEITDDEIVEVN